MMDNLGVYEMRPPDGFFSGDVHRYAGGLWVPDDGEWDMAFAGLTHNYIPILLYWSPPYYIDLEWQWLTAHWRVHYPRHVGGKPWHYSLTSSGDRWQDYEGRDAHPNVIAEKSARDWLSQRFRSRNGHRVHADLNDPLVQAGLVRHAATKEVLVPPETPTCVYCGLAWMQDRKGRA